jgi:hypothetical protein
MTPEHGAVDVGVQIRVPGHVWIPQFVMSVAFLVLGAVAVWRDRPLGGPYWLNIGGLGVAAALWARTLGVDLTRVRELARIPSAERSLAGSTGSRPLRARFQGRPAHSRRR